MASKVAIAARLMAGVLPPEAEDCFAEAGVALFPARDADLITSCDCADFSNPCKHKMRASRPRVRSPTFPAGQKRLGQEGEELLYFAEAVLPYLDEMSLRDEGGS